MILTILQIFLNPSKTEDWMLYSIPGFIVFFMMTADNPRKFKNTTKK